MLKKILIALGVFVLAVLGLAALQPNEFIVTRSIVVDAPPALAFAQVNELRRWEQWSPWLELDPNMRKSYEGPVAGEGSSHQWAGNSEVGEGKMTITKSQAPELVQLRLEFLKPMAAEHLAEFRFQSTDGRSTQVTWTMGGKQNYLCKLMTLVVNMDTMIGPKFEKGLAGIKEIAEKAKK